MFNKPTEDKPDDKDTAGSEPHQADISDFASGQVFKPKAGASPDDAGFAGRDAREDEYGYDSAPDSQTTTSGGSFSSSSTSTSSTTTIGDQTSFSSSFDDTSFFSDATGFDASSFGAETEAFGAPSTVTTASDIGRIWSWVTMRCHLSQERMKREFDEAQALGMTDIVLHLNDLSSALESDAFQFLDNNSPAAMRTTVMQATKELRKRGIDCHLLVFPAPHVGFTESMVSALLPLAQAAPIRSILLDAESNWRRRKDPDYDSAVDVITQRLQPTLAARQIALGFTDFELNDAGRELAQVCDYVMPQAFSTRSPGDREPGQMQLEKHELYQDLDKPMVMAVAAWNIRPPDGSSDFTPGQTLGFTWEAIERLSEPKIVEIAYWSLPAAHSVRPHKGQTPYNTPAESQSILQFLQEQGRQVRQAHPFVPGARFL